MPPWPKRPPKARRAALAPVHIVGVDSIKSTLFARLRAGETEGAGACHFPADRDYAWFGELVAERAVRKYTRGVARLEWVKDAGVRNEGLDTRVYATAALHGLYAAGWRLADLAARIKEAPLKTGSNQEPVSSAPTPAVIRSKFLS